MNTETGDALPMGEREEISAAQLAELSGLPESELRELVEYGAFDPIDARAATWTFKSYTIIVARAAVRLRNDFELDAHAVSVVLRFLERIDALESELRTLRARGAR